MKRSQQLIVRMALAKRSWGYTRIQGALANLGHDVGRGTIGNVLSEHGIYPAPERGKRSKIAGITFRPDEAWQMQMVRNLTDAEELFLRHTRFLIMDRDTKGCRKSIGRPSSTSWDWVIR